MRTSKVTQQEGMPLAHYGYPKARDMLEAYQKDPINNPPPEFLMPDNWDFIEKSDLERLGLIDENSSEKYNQYTNNKGQISNQFELLINNKTLEIVVSFKGSVEIENWVSDLTDSGAREFLKIQEKAEQALKAIQNHPAYANYHVSTAGHSLGGGMAQTFALKNNLDVHVYNSLPLTKGVVNSGYFDHDGKTGQEAYQARLEVYYQTAHVTNDVRTANDIASQSFAYKTIIPGSQANILFGTKGHSGYLSPEPTILPGNTAPAIVQVGAIIPMGLIMGVDHTMGEMRKATTNLSIDETTGRYVIPEGQRHLASINPTTRAMLNVFDDSPIYKIDSNPFNDQRDHPVATWQITRESGIHQTVSHYKDSGIVNLTEVNRDGSYRALEFNQADVLKALNGKQDLELNIATYDRNGVPLEHNIETVPSQQAIFNKTQSYTPTELVERTIEIDLNHLVNPKEINKLENMSPLLATLATEFNGSEIAEVTKSHSDSAFISRGVRSDSWDIRYEDQSNQKVIYHHESRHADITNINTDGTTEHISQHIPGLQKALKEGNEVQHKVDIKYGGDSSKPSILNIANKEREITQPSVDEELSTPEQSRSGWQKMEASCGDPDLDRLLEAGLNDDDALVFGLTKEIYERPDIQALEQGIQQEIQQDQIREQQRMLQEQQELQRQQQQEKAITKGPSISL